MDSMGNICICRDISSGTSVFLKWKTPERNKSMLWCLFLVFFFFTNTLGHNLSWPYFLAINLQHNATSDRHVYETYCTNDSAADAWKCLQMLTVTGRHCKNINAPSPIHSSSVQSSLRGEPNKISCKAFCLLSLNSCSEMQHSTAAFKEKNMSQTAYAL